MRTFNNTEKVIRWAKDNRCRSIGHMITELNMVDEKQLIFHLHRMVRKGFVTFNRIGQTVSFSLTRVGQNNLHLLNV